MENDESVSHPSHRLLEDAMKLASPTFPPPSTTVIYFEEKEQKHSSSSNDLKKNAIELLEIGSHLKEVSRLRIPFWT